ncbi:DUF3018 family protein [Synechococcus sp. CB0101]|uniref:antitoxin MazE-like protein n=1 Tax=Synechococcus sp. CB0101 TaxID=232348 RepID=UPI0008FEE01A|nr:antitoxin MazE-like protein [Synechococcus sp. CB0101]QCH15606.1 DUF3018 family protein [Synechococcus sp. CB0101]
MTSGGGPSSVEPRGDRRQAARLRVAAHRQRLREQGLRPIQIWVPDTRSEAFAAAAHAQSRAASASAHAEADQSFIDSIGLLNEL